jgi:hypothetical protein
MSNKIYRYSRLGRPSGRFQYTKTTNFPSRTLQKFRYMLSRRSIEERSQWKPCLREPFLGHTKKSFAAAQWKIFKDTPSTTWVLKSAHHILTYEALCGRSIKSYDQIVEFGAGIGETARLILDLGFRGDYYILDLPEIARISGFYLQGRANICTGFAEIPRRKNTLFIATWSLSEVPIEYRNEVVSFFKGCDFLIIFQNEIFEYNNYDYFTRAFPAVSGTSIRMHPIVWHRGAKGNWYLVARGLDEHPQTKSIDECSQNATTYVLPPVHNHQFRTSLYFLARKYRAKLRQRLHRLRLRR